MAMYQVSLNGCDDTTKIIIEANPAEFAFMTKLSALSEQESLFGCQPTMSVKMVVTCTKCSGKVYDDEGMECNWCDMGWQDVDGE